MDTEIGLIKIFLLLPYIYMFVLCIFDLVITNFNNSNYCISQTYFFYVALVLTFTFQVFFYLKLLLSPTKTCGP